MPSQSKSWVVKPLVPEAVYTDRQEFLDYFYEIARNAAHRRTMSTLLLGQRRIRIYKISEFSYFKMPHNIWPWLNWLLVVIVF